MIAGRLKFENGKEITLSFRGNKTPLGRLDIGTIESTTDDKRIFEKIMNKAEKLLAEKRLGSDEYSRNEIIVVRSTYQIIKRDEEQWN